MLQRIAVFNLDQLDAALEILLFAERASFGEGLKRVVRPEYNRDGNALRRG